MSTDRLDVLTTRASGPPNSNATRALAIAAVVIFYAGLSLVAIDKAFPGGGRFTAGTSSEASGAQGSSKAPAAAAGSDDTAGTGAGASSATAGLTTGGSEGGTAAPSTPTPAQPGGAPSAGAQVGQGASSRTGAGFSATEIKIGIELLDENSGTAAGAIGAKTTDTGPTDLYAQSIVNYLNAHGGMAGRKIVPIFHTTNLLTGTWDSQAQATCAAFVEDNRVFAVVSAFYELSDVLPACLEKGGVPVTLDGRAVRDQKYLGEHGDFVYMPSRMSADRWAALTVDGLSKQGYFERGSRLGIIRFDSEILRRVVRDVMRPKLASLGVAVVDEEAISPPNGLGEFGNAGSQISNAILRMRRAGVTHVIPVDDHGILTYLFMPAADSQGYRPRYGLSTNNQPFVQEENSPKAQLARAVGVGWTPADDVSFTSDPNDNPTTAVCREILRKAGANNFPSRYAWSNALDYCDSLFFYKAALDRAAELSPTGLRAATKMLGRTYASPYTFATDFGSGRKDGAAAARLFQFDTGCQCFRYSAPATTVP